MKKLVIGLLLFGSLSAFANSYSKKVFKCTLSATSTSISTAIDKKLPNEIKFKAIITSLRGKNKILRTETTSDLVSIAWAKKKSKSGFDTHLWRHVGGEVFKIKFKNLSSSKTQSLLSLLSLGNIPELESGLEPKMLKMTRSEYHNDYPSKKSVSQIHVKNSKDGEAYHLKIECRS